MFIFLSPTGQELYYSTHQFFLSERSLFLLVVDISKPFSASRLEFWYNNILSQVLLMILRSYSLPEPFTKMIWMLQG